MSTLITVLFSTLVGIFLGTIIYLSFNTVDNHIHYCGCYWRFYG